MSNEFLINFHKKHFSNTNTPVYSKETFYKILEEINRVDKELEKRGDNSECKRNLTISQ